MNEFSLLTASISRCLNLAANTGNLDTKEKMLLANFGELCAA
jgi:hypothetical protein